MKGKIILILAILIFLMTTSFVGAVSILDDRDNVNNLTYTANSLDIAVADTSPYDGVKIIFSDGNGGYSSIQDHRAGGDPEKVISEDFNRDGLDDLAAIDFLTGDLCVLLQKPAGGFELHEDQEYTGVGPKNLVSGHFNSDSYVDIAVITMGGDYVNMYNLNIFLGDGSGGFSKQASAPYTFNSRPDDLTTGDFNSDGNLDIAVVLGDPKTIRIYLNKNNGEGDFEYSGKVDTDGAWRIASGDFNNDGYCDLATTNPDSGTVSVFLGNPEESNLFEEVVKCPVGGSRPNGLTTGYFDDDGYLDIAVANGAYSGSVSVLLSNGGTDFKPYVTYSAGYTTACNIISGDINKDGKTDLVVVAITDAGSGGVSILYGDSNGKFSRTSLDGYEGSYWGVTLGEFGEFNNHNPNAPKITGKTNGEPEKYYVYTLSATDPENDFVKFEIDWGDGSEIEETFYSDGTRQESHWWNDVGEYTIKARTIDSNGAESEWTSLQVTMPKAKSFLLIEWIHSLIFRSLQKLLILTK